MRKEDGRIEENDKHLTCLECSALNHRSSIAKCKQKERDENERVSCANDEWHGVRVRSIHTLLTYIAMLAEILLAIFPGVERDIGVELDPVTALHAVLDEGLPDLYDIAR